MLYAECKDESNKFWYTTVPLKNCVFNDEGKLNHRTNQRKNFLDKETSNCSIKGWVLNCTCKYHRNTNKCEYDLRTIIENKNGKFYNCGKAQRKSNPIRH